MTNAINITQARVRENYPDLCSSLKDVGTFDVESCGNSDRYVYHMEGWNKARISTDIDGKVHFTIAGVSRPDNRYNIERRYVIHVE